MASEIDGDLQEQITETIDFLKQHSGDFDRLNADATVDLRHLDFGYSCRLSDEILTQEERLPVDFLTLVAHWKIAVVLSLYPGPSEGV